MYNDVREFLGSVWYARAEIERLSVRIKEMQTQATKMTSQATGMPRSGGADAQALWSRIVDDTDALYAKQRFYYEHVKLVEQFIDELSTDKYKEILKLRYVNCMSWPEVEGHLQHAGFYYEIRQVFRLHGAALEEARRVWEKKGDKYNG